MVSGDSILLLVDSIASCVGNLIGYFTQSSDAKERPVSSPNIAKTAPINNKNTNNQENIQSLNNTNKASNSNENKNTFKYRLSSNTIIDNDVKSGEFGNLSLIIIGSLSFLSTIAIVIFVLLRKKSNVRKRKR